MAHPCQPIILRREIRSGRASAGKTTRRLTLSYNEKQKARRKPCLSLNKEMRGSLLLFYCACSLLIGVQAIGRYRGLEFLEPCSRHDPKLEACLARTANILVEHFREGEISCKNCEWWYFLFIYLFFYFFFRISMRDLI